MSDLLFIHIPFLLLAARRQFFRVRVRVWQEQVTFFYEIMTKMSAL